MKNYLLLLVFFISAACSFQINPTLELDTDHFKPDSNIFDRALLDIFSKRNERNMSGYIKKNDVENKVSIALQQKFSSFSNSDEIEAYFVSIGGKCGRPLPKSFLQCSFQQHWYTWVVPSIFWFPYEHKKNRLVITFEVTYSEINNKEYNVNADLKVNNKEANLWNKD